MQLLIQGRNKDKFNDTLISVLNIVTVVAGRGAIPNQYDIQEAERMGRYWFRNDEYKRFDILGISNNTWGNIRDETDSSMVLEFSFRGDSSDRIKANAIAKVLTAFFNEDEVSIY